MNTVLWDFMSYHLINLIFFFLNIGLFAFQFWWVRLDFMCGLTLTLMCIYDQVVITELLLRHTIVIFIVIVTDPSKCVYFPSYFPSVFPFSPSVSPSPPWCCGGTVLLPWAMGLLCQGSVNCLTSSAAWRKSLGKCYPEFHNRWTERASWRHAMKRLPPEERAPGSDDSYEIISQRPLCHYRGQ